MAENSVVLSFYDTLLYRSDVELLQGPYWLNDTIISFYFEYLEKVLFSSADADKFLFVSPQVTQCLKFVERSEVKIFLEPLDMKKKDFIFFALNNNDKPDMAGGSHWSLFVYSTPEKKFLHLDSLNNSNDKDAWLLAANLANFMHCNVTIDFVDINCMQQENGYDCGVHVLCNAERLAECGLNQKQISSCDMMIEMDPTAKRGEILNIIETISYSQSI